MKKLPLFVAVMALALALAGCGSQTASSSTAESSSSAEQSSVAEQSVATVNWTEAANADEAAAGAGLDKFGVMDKIIADDMEFTEPKFAYAEGVAQALYEQPASQVDVRKGASGHKTPLTDRDTTEFANKWTKSYEDLDVTLYGPAKGAATVFTWSDGTQDYGVTFQGLGGDELSLDSDEVAAIVKGLKEANATEAPAAEPAEEQDDGLVEVPYVIGMAAADAAATIEQAGLSPDGAAEGTVVEQMPEAGARIAPGETVSMRVEVAEPDNGCVVPDVVGMSANDAAAAITQAGLSVDGGSEGMVVDQMPNAGAVLSPGETVSIRTEVQTEVEGYCTVPDIIGMAASDAAAAILQAGLTPDGMTEGVVYDQSPAAGAELDPGDTVSFAVEEWSDEGDDVASGECYVPDVVGLSANDAAAAILQAGLTPDGMTEGTVTEQMPEPGTALEPGDTVSFATDAG